MAQDSCTVAVVGVGSVGAMALWHLAQHGVPVVGYDSFTPGHDRGGAGGESRIFRVAYQEGARYVPLLTRARQLWQQLERESGQELFHTVGCATVGPQNHPKVVAVREAARLHKLRLEVLDVAEASSRVPEHPLRDYEQLLLDPLGGLLRPEAAVLAAVTMAEALGASVRRYTRVRDVRAEGDKAVVVTDAGEATYDRVIVSPGAWAPHLPLLQQLPLRPRLIPSIWFPRRDQTRFSLERTPVTIRVGDPEYSCFPSVDGSGVKLVPHDGFAELDDADALPRSLETRVVRAASESVRRTLPDIWPYPMRIGTYTDLFTPDHHGVVGRLGESKAVVAATGFCGHGFKLAPALGEVAARMAIDESHLELPFLDPSRRFYEMSPV